MNRQSKRHVRHATIVDSRQKGVYGTNVELSINSHTSSVDSFGTRDGISTVAPGCTILSVLEDCQ